MSKITADIIAELARNDDFGFEMRVGRALRDIPSAMVRHGETYVDPRTNKERAFDYQFKYSNGWRGLRLAIECKNLYRDAPVVVCGHRRVTPESFHDIVLSGYGILKGRGRGSPVQQGVVYEVMRVESESELYPTTDHFNNFVGKSLFRPKPPATDTKVEKLAKLPTHGFAIMRDDDEYDRWNQACGSAGAIALDTLEYGKSFEGGLGVATATIPVFVVPDDTLWLLEFSEEGGIIGKPESTNHVTVFRDCRIHNAQQHGTPFYCSITLSHVHFVTLTGLKAWLSEISDKQSPFWSRAFPESVAKQWTARFTTLSR